MTIIKSLKYFSETNKETIKKHRIHKPKKNRRPYPLNRSCSLYKQRIKQLTEKEISDEVDRLLKV